jgi:hypothetical protein
VPDLPRLSGTHKGTRIVVPDTIELSEEMPGGLSLHTDLLSFVPSPVVVDSDRGEGRSKGSCPSRGQELPQQRQGSSDHARSQRQYAEIYDTNAESCREAEVFNCRPSNSVWTGAAPTPLSMLTKLTKDCPSLVRSGRFRAR